MTVMGEIVHFSVVEVQAVHGSDPKTVFPILKQTLNLIVGVRVGFSRIQSVIIELISIESAQSAYCANLEKSLVVLQQGSDEIVGKTLINGDLLKFYGITGRLSPCRRQYQQT